jgi:uncharacterized protein YkwD
VLNSAARVRASVRTIVAVAVLAAAAAGMVATGSRAHADESGGFVAAANSARAASGLPAYAVSGDLAAAAYRQAQRMAATGVLAHTPNLGSAVCCWSDLGENVGEGASVAAVEAAFMASPGHRANILSGSYRQIGVGVVVDAKGRLWVSEIFRTPTGTVAAPPPPTVTHTAAPAPAPASTPRAALRTVAPATTSARPVATPAAVPGRASRDLARAPLDGSHQFALGLVHLGDVSLTQAAHQGADPIATGLDLAAAVARVGS